MRIKSCILFALGCLLVGSAKADVMAIRLRFGQDGTLTDIGTSLTSASMALSSPVVEPDGSVTNPEQIALASEEETDALFLTPAAAENEIDQATCESVSGIYKSYRGSNYCCSTAASTGASMAGLVYENGSWSSNVLMPQCGCYGSDVYTSMKLADPDGYYVCCQGHDQVESYATGASGSISDKEESDLCKCPAQATKGEKTYDIKELTDLDFTLDGLLYCCAGDYRLQTATVISDNEDDYCKCYNDNTRKNCTETACRKLGYNWCGEAGCSEHDCSVNCPSDGVVVQSGDTTICCKNGHKRLYDEETDTYSWETDIDMACVLCDQEGCGCPDQGTVAEESVCCKEKHAWDSTGYNKVDARCDCPTGYTKSGGVCCDNNNPGTYAGMTQEDESISAAIRFCGCATGETPEEVPDITNGYVCCKNFAVTRWTRDVMGEPSESDAHRYCGCPNGQEVNAAGLCADCWTNDFCTAKDATKPVCDVSENTCKACVSNSDCGTEKICTTEGCKSCVAPTPYYDDDDGVCKGCRSNADCTDGKICDPNTSTCETCVLYNAARDANLGCSGASTTVSGSEINQPYCVEVMTGTGRRCSECKGDADCSGKYPDLVHCLMEDGICSMDCGTAGVNPDTGECNCSGPTPVFNILTKKCVTCYNSISGAWTDLGCNKVDKKIVDDKPVSSPWNYSPWQAPKGKYNDRDAPVCWEGGNSGNGQCVECTDNDQCVGQKICNSDHTCSCPSDRPNYQQTTKRCLACDANNRASSGQWKCGATKPLCRSSDGVCTCSSNYDSSKKDGDGKCPSDHPMCNNGQCKTCAEVSSSTPFWNGSGCVACGTNMTYSTTEGKCICATGYCKPTSGNNCVAVSSYDDVTRASNGNCTKKSLQNTTYTMERESRSVGSCTKFTTLEKMRVQDKNKSTLRLLFSHKATVTTSGVDDCTYGTFVGKFTMSGSCETLAPSHSYQGGSFSTEITIPAGTHNNIYIEFEDIHCGAIAGGGSIKLKD